MSEEAGEAGVPVSAKLSAKLDVNKLIEDVADFAVDVGRAIGEDKQVSQSCVFTVENQVGYQFDVVSAVSAGGTEFFHQYPDRMSPATAEPWPRYWWALHGKGLDGAIGGLVFSNLGKNAPHIGFFACVRQMGDRIFGAYCGNVPLHERLPAIDLINFLSTPGSRPPGLEKDGWFVSNPNQKLLTVKKPGGYPMQIRGEFYRQKNERNFFHADFKVRPL